MHWKTTTEPQAKTHGCHAGGDCSIRTKATVHGGMGGEGWASEELPMGCSGQIEEESWA